MEPHEVLEMAIIFKMAAYYHKIRDLKSIGKEDKM